MQITLILWQRIDNIQTLPIIPVHTDPLSHYFYGCLNCQNFSGLFPMLTREQERQIEAKHLAQDLALEGADANAIRGALSEGQFDDCLDDGEIEHILSENAVVEHFELKQGNKLSHHLIRSFGVAVMLAGGAVWYFWGFDIIPLGAIVFGFLLAWVPDSAFSDFL